MFLLIDSLLSINLRRDINGPLDAETWWPEDPKSFFRRNGRKQFYGPTTEEDFGVVGVEAITTTESTTTIEAIVPKNLIFAITAKNVPLNDVLKQYVPGSVNQMKTAMDHIYYVNKARKPSRTTRKRTSVSYRRLSSKRKTVKPFEYISDYEDMLMTARTFTPIALFSEYDENEIENWRRVAQSMVYDYPEVHDTETKPKEEAYPIYDRGAIRKEYTGRRKKIKTAYYFIDPSYPATREVTSINHIDNTNTKSTKRLKYIFTNTKMSQGTESKEDVIEKDERDNKTHEYLGKVLAGYAR
ncbi:hypothetical protein RR46_11357 [Papilio xuthus]|uniref:Uncharacterized protein n=1 Tax=Papilio xuthus TaxID=66420 RepID=A0A194PSB2_PAPXU|nr:hypothetical protein RR46_11357 [Papilio xuthus]